MPKVSVVVNTRNEEKNLPHALVSIKNIADEIVVVDMHSEDSTREIAKNAGAKVFLHEPTGYVEPARNFALSKATGDWILVLDADEQIPTTLAEKLKKLIKKPEANFYRIPRLNIIFGKVIRHSRWWPDYNIRFFKKGTVSWSEIIHSVPETYGEGQDLPAEERYAIIHNHYTSVSQYFERMGRYTDVQAKFAVKEKYKFVWADLIKKPTSEFIGRFLAGEGYKDGVHGLVLALLQAFSEFLVLVKIWEMQKFPVQDLDKKALAQSVKNSSQELVYWFDQTGIQKKSLAEKILAKIFR